MAVIPQAVVVDKYKGTPRCREMKHFCDDYNPAKLSVRSQRVMFMMGKLENVFGCSRPVVHEQDPRKRRSAALR